MVERRSNKKDSAILIQYEKVREGDIVKLKDFYTGEFKIGRTTGFSESIFYYTSRKIKDLLTGDYVALYKFDFIEPRIRNWGSHVWKWQIQFRKRSRNSRCWIYASYRN